MDFNTGRALLQAAESSQDTAPFFGFIGAAAALVFSCEWAPVSTDTIVLACSSAPAAYWIDHGHRDMHGSRPAVCRDAEAHTWLLAGQICSDPERAEFSVRSSQAWELPMAQQSRVWALHPWE